MSQQFHAWGHMKKSELPKAVISLQVGILLDRCTFAFCMLYQVCYICPESLLNLAVNSSVCSLICALLTELSTGSFLSHALS